MEQAVDLFTDDENAILLNMVDKCEDLEFAKDSNFDACDYAFELEKCWKKTDPEVNNILIFIFLFRYLKKSILFCIIFSIITFCEVVETID